MNAAIALGGQAYAYREAGTGTPLVLLHGWSGSADNFAQWLPVLTPRYRVLVPNLPGCAGSPPLGERHTVAAYARFAAEFMDALSLPHALVGGLCSGASIAMSLAAAQPARVDALLLHTPFFHPSVIRPTMRAQLALLGTPAGAIYDVLRRNTFLANLYRRFTDGGTGIAPEEEERNRRNLALADPRAARELAVDLVRLDHRALLHEWTKPLHVIVADADAFVLVDSFRRQLLEVAPRADLHMLVGGHGWTPAYLAQQAAALNAFAA